MRYFLKKDLPGIKAGAEMEKVVLHSSEEISDSYIFQPGKFIEFSASILQGVWKSKESNAWHRIPNAELSDWIEEIDPKWKLGMDGIYFSPALDEETPGFDSFIWGDSLWDNARFAHNIVCPTPELAIELAERMIETAKKFWEEEK